MSEPSKTVSEGEWSTPYGADPDRAPAWRNWLRPYVMRAEGLLFPYVRRPRLRGRAQLPELLNARRLVGSGVEVGVWEGGFSDFLLGHWRGERLISVDPWLHWSEGYDDISNVGQEAMDRRYDRTVELLRKYGKRSEIWRMTGDEAAARIPNGSLDFVYLDAMHHEEAVSRDLATWYPKLRAGGVLAGHDYLDGNLPSGVFGVKTAVDRFTTVNGLELMVTTSESWPTWYFFTRP